MGKKKDLSLEGENFTKIGGMWILKHDINSTKFYELLIKTDIKVNTTMDLNNFYKHIKVCLIEMTIIR